MNTRKLPSMLLGLLLTPAVLPAATYCVGTRAELESALAQSSGDGVDDLILLKAGAYALTTTLRANLLAGENLGLSGGWQNAFGPCAVQGLDASASVLDGQGQRPVLSIEGSGGTNDIVVSNLTIANGLRTAGDNSVRAGGLTVYAQPNHTGSILVERVRFLGNSAAMPGAALAIVSRDDFVVRNNLFFGNSAPAATGMLLEAAGNGHVVNNTLRGNTATSPATSSVSIAFVYAPASQYLLSNNLMWANVVPGQDDLFATSQTVLFSNNIEVQGGAAAAVSVGNTALDPQFAPDSSGRLLASSPLVNRGITGALGGIGSLDLDARPRATGQVDIGAYELQEFRNGFE